MRAAEIGEALSMPCSTVSAVLRRVGIGRLSRLEPPEPDSDARDEPADAGHVKYDPVADEKLLAKLERMAGEAETEEDNREDVAAEASASSHGCGRPADVARPAWEPSPSTESW